jgi:hypothetical protein
MTLTHPSLGHSMKHGKVWRLLVIVRLCFRRGTLVMAVILLVHHVCFRNSGLW